ncbi:hypothetical protein SM39_pSMC2_10 (plasmid) [Serratia marcescens SM39]|nr:hypothetical protein SM39_pSMC2_10 [Serratia marcescens SM39]
MPLPVINFSRSAILPMSSILTAPETGRHGNKSPMHRCLGNKIRNKRKLLLPYFRQYGAVDSQKVPCLIGASGGNGAGGDRRPRTRRRNTLPVRLHAGRK